ncbi:Very low-density lipoprotein receptor [Eumeta japonica]|uniref:Very low-density lipoprotein receptor n=4 Tax=Ditrysia TaxID=37567 RepID=A0A4C1ZY03_EUMVA|nr:Very low-density lipoprotein receptor [Eumeta japonica]
MEQTTARRLRVCVPMHPRTKVEQALTRETSSENCPVAPKMKSPCISTEFECRDRITCVHKSWVCDGDHDCPDGGDEAPALCRGNVTCRLDQFQCSDRSCIPGALYCNGDRDCPDGSDEFNCSKPKPVCDKKTEFDCGGGMCIPLSKVCDKKPDCPNFEDEPRDRCGEDECAKNNGGCTQRCVDTPVGYYCDCDKGYRLVDNRTCEGEYFIVNEFYSINIFYAFRTVLIFYVATPNFPDIDECLDPGSCSQICYNEKGTFKCECHSGYARDPRDRTRCKATEGHPSLLFARRFDIRKISLDHHEMVAIVNETKSATALDYVFRTGMIFWSDVTDEKIYKAPIDEGSQRTVVIGEQLITSDGLAVDWIYNHLYWTDTGKNHIELSDLQGNMRKILIRDRLEEPRAIALNPLDGWMYWTDWGQNPKIERAGMDGSHRQTIVSYDVKWPNGLTLDLVRKRVYWVDAKQNTISSCDYDGSARRVILYSTDILRHPFSITTFEDWVYWTDWDKAAVYRANKFNGKDVEAITATHMLQNPMVIHVYHPYRQPDGVNHCAAVNGHCSHLCLPAPHLGPHAPRVACACPTGLRLFPDNQMCVEDETTLSCRSRMLLSYRRQGSLAAPDPYWVSVGVLSLNADNEYHDSQNLVQVGRNLVSKKATFVIAESFVIAEFRLKEWNDVITVGLMGKAEALAGRWATPSEGLGTDTVPTVEEVTEAIIDKIGINAVNVRPSTSEYFRRPGLITFLLLALLLSPVPYGESKEGSARLPKLGHSWLENDPTETPEEVETTKVASKIDPNVDSMVYWESQKSEVGANNVPFRESAALSRIPDAVEEPFTETYYNFADLSITYLPELAKVPELNGAPETPSGGAGIQTGGQDAGVVAAIVVAVISGVIIFAALIAAVMYRHYVHRNVTSMNFDNPVYRKTTEDQFALEKNGYAPGTKLYPSTVGEEVRALTAMECTLNIQNSLR